MNKFKKILVAAMVATVATTAAACFAACGGEQSAELTGLYQSQTRLKYFTAATDRDFFIAETYSVELYSDGTYVCAINLSECQQKLANFEYDEVNVIAPLAVTTFTRTGTYTITEDESVGTFELTLSAADRLTYSTNAGGGHYPVVPTDGAKYYDSADPESIADFETEWYGGWDELYDLVGTEVTLTGDSATHLFDAGCMVFDYKSPMFYTLLGRDDLY